MSSKKGESMRYIALAEGLNTRKLVPVTYDVSSYIKKRADKDFYISLYKYKEDHLNKFKKTNTLSGIKDVETDRLFFDFDHDSDLEKARQDAVTVCRRLIEKDVDPDNINIYFSGGKGFHLELLLDRDLNRKQFKNIVFGLASDLPTFDTRINDEQRVIRAPLTKHPKTNLFKIPLELEELIESSIEEITDKASNLDGIVERDYKKTELPEEILELKEVETKISDEVVDLEDLKFDKHQLKLEKCPKWLTPDRYALQEGFFPVGERNDALMILAATYKKNGINKNIAAAMLKETAKLQAARTGEDPFSDRQIESTIVNVVYSPDWNGGVYSSEHPILAKTRKRLELPEPGQSKEFDSGSEMFRSFVHYAENIEQNTIKTGMPFDEDIRLTIGMPVALLGAPSSGKTTILLNILRNTSKEGISSIFFSLDMHKALICQKQLQLIFSGHTSDDIYKNITDEEWRERYEKGLDTNFGNVHYFTKAGVTVEDIRYYVEKKKEELGENLKLVAIDYLECIRGPYSDPTTNTSIIADGIKNIAIELDVCVLLLVQPPKITGGAAFPLTNMYQIKGSSMVAQAMRSVIGIYREGFSPETVEDDKYITFVGLKNSMGSLFKKDCSWDGRTGRIGTLNVYEQDMLEELRSRLKAERADNDL